MSEKKDPNDIEKMFMLSAIVGFGFLFIVWFFFHAELSTAFRWFRFAEIWLASLVMPEDSAVNIPGMGVRSLSSALAWLQQTEIRDISWDEARAITYIATTPLKPIFAVLLGAMGAWVIFSNPGSRYNRKMNLASLMREQAKTFPVIAPFIEFDPCKTHHRVFGKEVPRKLPIFSEALSPEEWVAYYEVPYQNKQLDYNKAFRTLSIQLGKRWQGPQKLPIHAQGLYAACALKHVRKRDESEEILNQLALSWSEKKGFRPSGKLKKQIRTIINDPKTGGELQKYADKHAFTTTALLRSLARAREEGGVLASASFLWLRAVDRELWYPLNNLGRKSYHAEAAGAMVHYTNELIAGQKIPVPQFESAIKGFEDFIKGPAGKPIPPLEPVKSKK